LTTISKLAEKLRDFEYRKAFVASQIYIGLPFQLRALLKARGKTQEWLAEKTGMLQPRISGLLNPGKTRPNIETLRRLAEAFDCGLAVRFVPFSELAGWSERFDPESFDVPEFDNDPGLLERRPAGSEGLNKNYLAATGTGGNDPNAVAGGQGKTVSILSGRMMPPASTEASCISPCGNDWNAYVKGN
jgi:transcriptional regulator with XRE-family HTH domain